MCSVGHQDVLDAPDAESYGGISLKNLPRDWFDNLPHTHIALDDAIEQGVLFCNALAFAEKLGIAKKLITLASQ